MKNHIRNKRQCLFLAACLLGSLLVSVCPQGNRETATAQETGLLNEPTVVADVRSQEDLQALTDGDAASPSNAILRYDAQGNVTDVNGNILGVFSDICENILKDGILPVLYLESEEAAAAAADFLAGRFYDLAVMSDQPDLVKYVREQADYVRGIVSFGEGTDAYEAVRIANVSYANTVAIPQSMAESSYIRYIRARFKSVWVLAEDIGGIGLYDTVVSGADGIVSSDSFSVASALKDLNGITASPFNVAHRGLPNTNHENSVSGTQAAILNGATHIELDLYLALDGDIVLMHDATIDRTSNGSGAIEGMTRSQLDEYRLDLFYPEERIPSLEDILDTVRGTDAVLILEIKSKQDKIVEILKDIVAEKSELDGYDYRKQITVISFSTVILNRMRTDYPEIPTAYLGVVGTEDEQELLTLLGKYNTAADAINSAANAQFETFLRRHGYAGWYWTYSNFTQAASCGYTGLTSNDASAGADCVMAVQGKENQVATAAGDEVVLTATSYSGKETEVSGTVAFAEALGDGRIAVIASYPDGTVGTLYSRVFTTYDSEESKALHQEPEPDESEPKQDGSEPKRGLSTAAVVGIAVGATAGAAAIAVAAVLIVKRKK